MKKITLMAALLGSAYFANAQVGIGTPNPSKSSMLHIEAEDKGVVIPNVNLTSTNVYAPIGGDTETRSLLVYNINTAGDTSTTAVTPGFYYWENSVWQRITTKAELDAAVGNVTNLQNNISEIKKLLQTVYPANNLDSPTSTSGSSFGGGLIYQPTADTATGSHVGYVYFDSATSTYKTQFITLDSLGFTESKTYIKTINNKQYFVSEGFKGDSSTITGTEPGVYLIDVVGGVVNNFNEIIGDTTTIVNINGNTTTVAQYFQSLAADSNTVYFNNTADTSTIGNVQVPAYTFYLKDGDGKPQIINLPAIIKSLEKVTTLTGDSTTGQYTYKNELDSETVIDVTGSVINNFGQIVGDSTTVVTINGTTTTINEFFNSLGGDSATLTLNPDGTYTFVDASGKSTTINIPASVVNKFEQILGDTTTYNNTELTIKEIIEQIASEASGNMTFIPGADSSTLLSKAQFQYVDTATNTIVTKTFEELIQANETLTSLTGDSNTGVISYEPERGTTQTVDVVEMVVNNLDDIITAPTTIDSSTTTLVNYIQNMIDSSTVAGGNVFYGNVDSSTNVLYTQEGDSKTVIDVVSTVVNNTTLTGDTNKDVAITNNINKLKNNLGNVLNGDTNTSVFTGDTYKEGNTTYYIYKGVFATTVNKGTAVTTGITVDKKVNKILSISLNYNEGLTASVTDVNIGLSTPTNIGMNVGVGKMYNVLDAADISAKVMVEFASAEKPQGL